jgi:hypothetical protein
MKVFVVSLVVLSSVFSSCDSIDSSNLDSLKIARSEAIEKKKELKSDY